MKRYFGLYVVLSILAILSIAGINLYCDPAYIFSSARYEQRIADILLSGRNVENITDFDLRSVQKKYISGLSTENQVIVLGSSRSMNITRELFPNKTFFNHSVITACLEDYLAIYELYEQHNYSPSTVILGVDPWILNRNNNFPRWSILKEEYFSMVKRLNIPESIMSKPSNIQKFKLTELISLPYFRESIMQLISGRTANTKPQATEDKNFPSAGILSDGSRIWSQEKRNKTTAEVEASAIACVNIPPIAGLEKFAVLDADYHSQLVEFIKYLQAKNTEVFFFLPQYHPTTYQMLSNSDNYNVINRAESSFREIAEDLGITVIGSYNPEQSSCTADEFYDGEHPKESAVFKSFVAAGLIMP